MAVTLSRGQQGVSEQACDTHRGGCPSELGQRVPRSLGKPFPQRLPSKPGFTFQTFSFLGCRSKLRQTRYLKRASQVALRVKNPPAMQV